MHKQYLNTNPITEQVLGILIVIPVTGISEQPIIQIYFKCEKCGRIQDGNFCSNCGGKIIEYTEQLKDYKGNVEMSELPTPDVREEMKSFGVESYSPFKYDYLIDDWVFLIKKYKSPGNPRNFVRLSELNLQQIQNDLNETKEKFKDIITKYNGKVVFGIAGSSSIGNE